MAKIRLIQQVRDAFSSLRKRLRTDRTKLINRAIDLFDEGLIAEEVYIELREEYIDSIPLIVERGDAAIDWESVAPGVLGDLLEAIDGPVIERLLKGIVNAADRRYRRRQTADALGQYVGTLGEAMARLQGARVQPGRGRRPPVAETLDVIPAPADPDESPSRSSGLGLEEGDAWGMNGSIS
jgi:hypothetical protein